MTINTPCQSAYTYVHAMNCMNESFCQWYACNAQEIVSGSKYIWREQWPFTIPGGWVCLCVYKVMHRWKTVSSIHVDYTCPWFDACTPIRRDSNDFPTKSRLRGGFVNLGKRILIQISQSALSSETSLTSNDCVIVLFKQSYFHIFESIDHQRIKIADK